MITSHFASLSQFLHMGGYAGYVWPAYGICVVILVVQVLRAKGLNTIER